MDQVTVEVDDLRHATSSTFTQSLSIVNNTDKVLYVYGRQGYTAQVKPERDMTVHPGVYFNFRVKNDTPVKIDDCSHLVDVSSPGIVGRRPLYSYSSYTRVREELIEGSVSELYYIVEHDVVLSFKSFEQDSTHPFSKGGIIATLCDVDNKSADDRTDFTISIVDNKSTFGDRFINIGGKAFKIPAIKSSKLTSGIYISRTNQVEINGQIVTHKPEVYGFEQVGEKDFPFRLFSNPEEAENFDAEAEQRKELARLKLDHEQMKHVYEQRTLERKDASDGWKLIPAVVLGLATLVKLIF